jgi:hypothetical protein
VVIALVLAIGLVDGCPIPSNKRTVPALLPAVKEMRVLRTQALAPFRSVRDGFRLHQLWKLFPTASLNQHRMWVEGRAGKSGAWQILYRPLDPEHTFKADEIEYRRLRGAWNPGRSARRGYAGFVKWVAGEVFAAWPELDEVRVRLEKIRVNPREGKFEPTGKFQYERTRRREKQLEKPVVIEPAAPTEEPEP